MKKEKTLGRHLSSLNGLNRELGRDTFFSLRELKREIDNHIAGKGDLDSTAFWLRATIRSFMAQAEGLSSWMRSVVLDMHENAGLGLSNKICAELAELRYDKNSDAIIQELSSKGPRETLKLAFRYFPRLFGSPWRLDTNDPGWGDFLEILRQRTRAAHPTRMECFYPIQAIPHLFPAISWFYSSFLGMFADCARCLGVQVRTERETWDLSLLRSVPVPRIDPMPEVYERIEASGGNSLAYVNEVFRLIHADVSRSLSVLRDSFSGARIITPWIAFAARNAARALFAGLEGNVAAFEFFIMAAEKRREIMLSVQDREMLADTKEECARAALVAGLFSKLFGYSRCPRTEGDGWRALMIARAFRDRITHPKSLRYLDVKVGTISTLSDALGWYAGQFFESVEIDNQCWDRLLERASVEELLPDSAVANEL